MGIISQKFGIRWLYIFWFISLCYFSFFEKFQHTIHNCNCNGSNLIAMLCHITGFQLDMSAKIRIIQFCLQKCNIITSTRMDCKSPDLQSVTDSTCGNFDSNDTRQKRSTESNFEFHIGFKLDGVKGFTKTSNSPWLNQTKLKVSFSFPTIHYFKGQDQIKTIGDGVENLQIDGDNFKAGRFIQIKL